MKHYLSIALSCTATLFLFKKNPWLVDNLDVVFFHFKDVERVMNSEDPKMEVAWIFKLQDYLLAQGHDPHGEPFIPRKLLPPEVLKFWDDFREALKGKVFSNVEYGQSLGAALADLGHTVYIDGKTVKPSDVEFAKSSCSYNWDETVLHAMEILAATGKAPHLKERMDTVLNAARELTKDSDDGHTTSSIAKDAIKLMDDLQEWKAISWEEFEKGVAELSMKFMAKQWRKEHPEPPEEIRKLCGSGKECEASTLT